MSHLNKISSIRIKDLVAFKAACERLGAVFKENQKTNEYYSGQGQCSHAVGIKGVTYEVGLVGNAKDGYEMQADLYGSGYKRSIGGGNHDGNCLLEKFGEGFTKLVDAYSIESLRRQARSNGYMCSEKIRADGRTALIVTKS